MADRITPTREIVEVEGEKVRRTTTVVDVTGTELQGQIDRVTAEIESTMARYISPLEARKAVLVAELADLAESVAVPARI